MTMSAIHNDVAFSTGCSLRPACDADASFLFDLFLERNRARFAPLGWSEFQLRSMLKTQYQARAIGYRQRFAGLQHSIICDQTSQPIGELFQQHTEQEIYIVDLCVSATHRGRGIGTWVLQELQCEAEKLTLRVDLGNPARRLYERLGFQETGRDDLQSEMCWRSTAMHQPGSSRMVNQL